MLLLGGLAPAQTPFPAQTLAPTVPSLSAPPPAVPAIKVMPGKGKPHEQFAGERPPIQQVEGYGPGMGGDVASGEYQYLVAVPGPDQLFSSLESEAQFQARLQNEHRANGYTKDRLIFPDEPVLSKEAYAGRSWPQYNETVEPYFVAHKRLLFDQINRERYGWDLGVLDPPLAAGQFFADVALLPYHAFTDPFRCYDTGAGYCLPGDPTPYLLYPPEISASGAVAETGAILTVLAVFP